MTVFFSVFVELRFHVWSGNDELLHVVDSCGEETRFSWCGMFSLWFDGGEMVCVSSCVLWTISPHFLCEGVHGS